MSSTWRRRYRLGAPLDRKDQREFANTLVRSFHDGIKAEHVRGASETAEQYEARVNAIAYERAIAYIERVIERATDKCIGLLQIFALAAAGFGIWVTRSGAAINLDQIMLLVFTLIFCVFLSMTLVMAWWRQADDWTSRPRHLDLWIRVAAGRTVTLMVVIYATYAIGAAYLLLNVVLPCMKCS
jgi:membrane protein implicated in regulation of membrane protease activity